MIIVRPSDALGYTADNWTGQINEIAKINQNQINVLGRELSRRTDEL